MPTEYDYQTDCDNIDEDRQERMAKEKEKAKHINWKLHQKKTASIKSANLEVRNEKAHSV